MISEDVRQRILKIKAVIFDIDGVLTDGRIVLGNYGDELKFFDAQDGLGLVLLRRAGFKTAMVSSRKSRINQKRARETDVTRLYQNVSDKRGGFDKLLRKFKIAADEACFVGDDLVDIPALVKAGLAVAVQNAAPAVKEIAHYVTEKEGGRGAAREISDLLLKTQGRWDALVKPYTSQE